MVIHLLRVRGEDSSCVYTELECECVILEQREGRGLDAVKKKKNRKEMSPKASKADQCTLVN